MSADLEFLLGLLDEDKPSVASEDLDGEHGSALRIWRDMGFLSGEPGVNPVAGCPHCGEGVPYLINGKHLCNRCRSRVDARHLLLWRLDRDAFLRWLAARLRLQGGVRPIEERLWQLGAFEADDGLFECFYQRRGPLLDLGRTRLSAYRNVIVFYGLSPPPAADHVAGRCVFLLELLRFRDALTVADLGSLLRPKGNVRFDGASGTLWVGEAWLGEVPVGSKEFFFLDCLASQLDGFVPYQDLKQYVLRASGSTDTTEEATFCQGLKSRIKKKWMPKIDVLLTTTNKGDAYRLRGHAQLYFVNVGDWAELLEKHRDEQGSRIWDGLSDSLELVMSDPTMWNSHTHVAVIAITDMENNLVDRYTSEQRLTTDLTAFAKGGGVIGMYFVGTGETIRWRQKLPTMGFKDFVVSPAAEAKPRLPSFE